MEAIKTPHADIDEHRAYQRKWKRENREKIIRSERKRRMRNKQHMIKRKMEFGCSQCSYNEHPAALDFDHIDPSKKTKGISQLANGTGSIKKLDAEMDKCIVLCANCHRVKSAKDLGYYNWIDGSIVWKEGV